MFGEYRYTSVESRISQLQTLRDLFPEFWKNCTVFFADDNFIGTWDSQPITKEMLRMMIAKNLIPPKGWVCQMRVTDADLETVRLMKSAGCIVVCLGIESTNAVALKVAHKGQTPEDIHMGLECLNGQGIQILAMTIAGLDSDTFWSFFKGVRQLRKWGITFIQILAIVPLLGTKMTNDLISQGIRFSTNYDHFNGMHVLLKSRRMTKLGIWMAVYFITIWYYFLTTNGLKLYIKYPVYCIKMICVVFLALVRKLQNNRNSLI